MTFSTPEQVQQRAQRTLPGMLTASGPIFVGYAKVAILPLATEFMFVRELAWRAIDPHYPVQTSLGRNVQDDEVDDVYDTHAASLIGTFVVLSPVAQVHFLGELLRYIEFHADATGLEGILTTAIQSTWQFTDLQLSTRGLKVWSKYARRGRYAESKSTIAFDERTRTLRFFLPGELAEVSADAGTMDLIARAAPADPHLNRPDQNVVPGRPDFKGVGWSGAPLGPQSLDDFRKGLHGPGVDYRGSPTSGSSPAGPVGPGDLFDDPTEGLGNWAKGQLGKPGIDYRGSPTSGSSPAGPGGGKGVQGLLDSFGNPLKGIDKTGDTTGKGLQGFGHGFGPFSEAFIGRPGPPGREVGSWSDLKTGWGGTVVLIGTAIGGAGLVGLAAAPATGGLSGLVGVGWVVTGAALTTIGGYIVSEGLTDREIAKEQREADRTAAAKAADKAEKAAEKAAEDKAAAEKKAAEDKAAAEAAAKAKGGTTPPPPEDPKKKGESGLPDDPYGGGGGNPAWGRLDQIPVDDSGGGGVGPKWLNALPVDDGTGGVGPKWLASLPVGDGSGGGRPNSAFATFMLTAAGPGLQSLCIKTSDRTMLLLGMPKLANDGSVADAGILGALLS